jgi:hypothetical protein
MAVKSERLSPAEHLDRRIKEHLAEAERWRAENGDPAEALGAFLRDWIGLEALEETYEEWLRHEDSFLFEDYDDDTTEDEDGREPG